MASIRAGRAFEVRLCASAFGALEKRVWRLRLGAHNSASKIAPPPWRLRRRRLFKKARLQNAPLAPPPWRQARLRNAPLVPPPLAPPPWRPS